jgi:hypothetical protein
MTKRKDKLRGEILTFMKQYVQTSRRPNADPNDRVYDRRVEKRVKRMDPAELDAILRGDDEDED